VQQGRVKLEMSTRQAHRKAVLTVGAGDLLAWSALLGDGRMTATATTMVPTTLTAFVASELLACCDSNHDLGYVVMKNLSRSVSRRLVATRIQLLDLFESPTATGS
ncbi:MAG: cyclic nucleotide-binding domain-containing protein, partial [Planctomycetota bacterium]